MKSEHHDQMTQFVHNHQDQVKKEPENRADRVGMMISVHFSQLDLQLRKLDPREVSGGMAPAAGMKSLLDGVHPSVMVGRNCLEGQSWSIAGNCCADQRQQTTLDLTTRVRFRMRRGRECH
jgi:hypothetical protein